MDKEKTQGITKRNLYLILMAAALLVIGITVTVALATSNKQQKAEIGQSSGTPSSSSTIQQSSSTKPQQSSSAKPQQSSSTPAQSSSEDDTPTDATPEPVFTQIIFDMPVANGTLLKEYTSNGVIYNKTLGQYSGHMGVDITGAEGANVVAAYDGIIQSVSSAYLTGTTIVINHNDELTTVYNSLEALEGLSEGQAVKKGDVLGYIAANNLQEYKDGAHLHFEVLENGQKVDPFKYLSAEEK